MNTRTLKLAAFTFLVALILPLFFMGGEASSDNNILDQHSTGEGTVEALDSAYNEWKVQFEQAGGERNISIPLGWSKALTTENIPGSASLYLNLIDGSLSVDAQGLDPNSSFDFWMVDNHKSQVIPEDTDSFLKVGSLSKDGKLQASLGPDAFSSFDPDLFVISRAGKSPIESRLLIGMTSLYHRLYRSSQNPSQGVLADLEIPKLEAGDQGWIDRVASALMPTAEAQIGPIPNPTTPQQL
jgi:hypothetical protein